MSCHSVPHRPNELSAVFYENLDLPCVFQQILKADRRTAAAMRADTMFGAGLAPSCAIHHYCEHLARMAVPAAWLPDAHCFDQRRIIVVYE